MLKGAPDSALGRRSASTTTCCDTASCPCAEPGRATARHAPQIRANSCGRRPMPFPLSLRPRFMRRDYWLAAQLCKAIHASATMSTALRASAPSSFVEVDQVWNRRDVSAIGETGFVLAFVQERCRKIVPAQLRTESVPDQDVAAVQAPAFFETPFENFFIAPAGESAFPQVAIMHAQKIAADAGRGLHRPEVLVIFLPQLAPGMQPNLVQHPREIHQSAGHFL